ncbi:MAG: hypothetical protein V3V74_07790 [Nitrosomonadaceae bacterium]
MGKIESDFQLKITAAWLVRFHGSVKKMKAVEAPNTANELLLRKAEIDAAESQIESFIEEIDEYVGSDFLDKFKGEKCVKQNTSEKNTNDTNR